MKSAKAAPKGNGEKAAKKVSSRRKVPREARPIDRTALDRSLGYSLRRAQLSTYPEFTAAMDEHAVRPSHYVVLLLIRSNPGLSQSAASASLGIQKANFVTLLDGLEGRGWTERRAVGGDRRTSALHLTHAGETFVAKLELAHDAMERRLAKRLGGRKTATLLKLLHEFSIAGEKRLLKL